MLILAAQNKQYVCAVDVAGGDSYYADRLEEWISLYDYARSLGVKTTGHLYETTAGCYPELLPLSYANGHGIQIHPTVSRVT